MKPKIIILNPGNLTWVLVISLAFGFLAPAVSTAQSPVTPVRGVTGDLWADTVLGQLDFASMTDGVMGNKHLCRPGGAFIDRVSNPQRLYVYDAGNNRILGFSNIATLQPNLSAAAGYGADIVLGQPDFTHTYANGDSQLQVFPGFPFAEYLSLTDPLPAPTASSLCLLDPRVVSPGESGSDTTLAVDSQANLYVVDFYNNRVLRYNSPVTSGEAASYVWGQPDFAGYNPNQGGSPTNSTLCFPNGRGFLVAGVAIDNWGNLWVTDTGNDRVMRFPNPNAPGLGVPVTTADIILGQTGSPAALDTDWTRFYYPGSVRVDTYGNVFVADGPPSAARSTQGGRVLIFEPTGNSNGLPTYNSGETASGWITYGLSWPTGLEFDASGNLWVNDTLDQILQYTLNYSTSPPTATAQKLLLLAQVNTGSNFADPTSADGPDFSNYAYPPGSTLQAWAPEGFHENWGGLGVDQAGDVWVSFINVMVDVLRYPVPIPNIGALPAGEAHAPDVSVFKPPLNPAVSGYNPITTNSVSGLGLAVGYSSSVTQLIATDNHRMTYWNLDYTNPPSLGLTNGKNADGFAGTTSSVVNFPAGQEFGRIWTDQASPQPHVWVVRGWGGYSQIVEVYNLPLTPWATAAATVTGPFPVFGKGTTFTYGQRLDGIATDPTGSYLWLSDTNNNRVFRLRNPLSSPQVDIILGQTSASTTLVNQGGTLGAKTLNQPGAVAFDHHGNFYVSDFSLEANGNGRLLQFSASSVQNNGTACLFDPAASNVYAENGNLSGSCANFGNPSLSPCGPWEPAFRSDDNVMVVGTMGYTGSRWPVVFYYPLLNFNSPTTFMNDFQSMGGYSQAFDSQDNLFLADPDREHVLVYWKPFAAELPATATPTPTPCACPVTQLVYGTNGSGTGNGVVNGAGQIALGTTNGVEYLYICDINNSRVEQYNASTGAWVANLRGAGADNPYGGMSNPYGCALSPDGHYLFVGNTNGGNVVKLDMTSAGAPVTAFGVVHPVRMAADASGGVYVTDDYTVKKFVEGAPNQYSCVATLGTPNVSGTGATLFNKPYNVLPEGNDLIIADNSNARIVRWTTTDGVHYAYANTLYTSTTGAAFDQMALEPGTNHVHVGSDYAGYFIFDQSTTPWTLLFQCNPSGSGNSTGGVAVDSNWLYVSTAPANPAGRYQKPQLACFTPVTLPTNSPTPNLSLTPTNSPTASPTQSATPTHTATPSPTPTVTLTSTGTPTQSPTGTLSPSNTPTDTPILTMTPTPSDTGTSTATPTPTPTFSFTSTSTPSPTNTPTPTDTWTATSTNTLTPTASPTETFTPTFSSTPAATGVVIGPPFPNPAGPGPLTIPLLAPTGSTVEWSVFTTAFRKILDVTQPIQGGPAALAWKLEDAWGKPVADGLYYLRVQVTGPVKASRILKVLVTR